MLRLLIAAILILGSVRVFAESAPQENLFQKGLAAYQNKQFAEARDAFQKLIEEGVVSVSLLHNLALAQFQLGQQPLALALWRKALSVEPGFRPARLGRDFAEGKLQARGFERDPFAESLRRTLEHVSFFESLWLIALLLLGTGYYWLRYWAERKHALDEERPLPAFPTAATGLTVVLAVCLGLVALKTQLSLRTYATVTVEHTSARSLPAEEGVGLVELRGGTEVLVRRRDNNWLQVQNAEGASGWVRNDEIFITSGR